jgi:hypothetical protein
MVGWLDVGRSVGGCGGGYNGIDIDVGIAIGMDVQYSSRIMEG